LAGCWAHAVPTISRHRFKGTLGPKDVLDDQDNQLKIQENDAPSERAVAKISY
jgi:hypothetical protein